MRRCAHECVCWAMVEYGDAECPGLCDAYAPMVDVDALRAMADEMDTVAASKDTYMVPYWYLEDYASRIRKALPGSSCDSTARP